MPIYELDLKNIGPFEDIHFEFDPRINVFVGPNNCGKSTVLMALSDIAVYGFSVPEKLLGTKGAKFRVCKGCTLSKKKMYEGELPIVADSIFAPNKFWTKHKFDSWTATLEEIGYSCLIPALRISTDYRASSAISEEVKKSEISTTEKSKDLSKRLTLFEPNASVVNDEALIQKMINIDYKALREGKPEIRKIIDKIAMIASEITDGFSIKFAGIKEDSKGFYPEFDTPDGKLPLNVLSQGTQSIIQWLGLLLIGYAEYYNFPKNLEKKRGVVIIDEIDAHMHPSWQRRILPSLSHNFPNLQIFCSTHSPLVLAGLKADQAHLLKRNTKGKVVVSRNENDIIGWSTDEILRSFLDITNPTDLQTDESIERLQELRRKRKLTPKQKNEIGKLRDTVSQQLQAGPVASEVQRFSELIQEGLPGFKLPVAKKTNKKTKKGSTARNKNVRVKGGGK